MPIVLGAKSSILDVKAKDKVGNEYIVEMQMTDKLGFAKRVVYYMPKAIRRNSTSEINITC